MKSILSKPDEILRNRILFKTLKSKYNETLFRKEINLRRVCDGDYFRLE